VLFCVICNLIHVPVRFFLFFCKASVDSVRMEYYDSHKLLIHHDLIRAVDHVLLQCACGSVALFI
jgi:hypothetical protein